MLYRKLLLGLLPIWMSREKSQGTTTPRRGPPENMDADAIFDRVLAVEARSWKGRIGEGFDREPGCHFYRDVVRRLAADNALRVRFLHRDGIDYGFVFGGVVHGAYRGLQLSFDADFKKLSLGNFLQMNLMFYVMDC